MKKYLIYRTDRVGDFIVTCILIKNIKRNNPNSNISVICSRKNYAYASTLSFIDNAILYPDSLIKKIFLNFALLKNKYECIFSLDGKKRSLLGTIILRSKIKIFSVTKRIYKLFFSFFYKNVFYVKDYKFRIDEFKIILSKLNFDYKNEDLNIFDNETFFSKNNFITNINSKSFILFHLDEKWLTAAYKDRKGPRNFKAIDPSNEKLLEFFKQVINKTKLDIVITPGAKTNILINDLKKKINKSITGANYMEYEKKNIFIINDLSFTDLKFIIKKAKLLITCHGSPTHVASSFNVDIIDIFDEKTQDFYIFWTHHLRNYKYLYRENFNSLSNKIINLI